MNEQLLKQRITGEVLLLYDSIIKNWVATQIQDAETQSGVTEDRVNELIESALSNFSGDVSDERIREMVNEVIADIQQGSTITESRVQEMIDASGHATESRVQEMIDASIVSAISDSY